jgi:hypothetical protein
VFNLYTDEQSLTSDQRRLTLSLVDDGLQPVTKEQHLNVREIADCIRRPHETTKTVIDRIRSWADYGLLQPSGEKHPGTGKKRRYGPSAIIDSVVLTALTDIGVAAVRVGHFKDKNGQALLSIGRVGAFKVLANEDSNETPWFLIVAPPAPGSAEPTSIASYQSVLPYEPDDELGIVGKPRPNVLIPPRAQSAIVLNLTDYLRPLRAVLGVRVDEQAGELEFYLKDAGANDGEH